MNSYHRYPMSGSDPGAVSRVAGGKLWGPRRGSTGSSTVLDDIVRRPGEPRLLGAVPALEVKRWEVRLGASHSVSAERGPGRCHRNSPGACIT